MKELTFAILFVGGMIFALCGEAGILNITTPLPLSLDDILLPILGLFLGGVMIGFSLRKAVEISDND